MGKLKFLSAVPLTVTLQFAPKALGSSQWVTSKPQQTEPTVRVQRQLSVDFEGVIRQISTSGRNPFVTERSAKMHPGYKNLLSLAHSLGTNVQWVRSVSRAVLRLPYHPDRLPVSTQDEFNGWFDEYVFPHRVFVHRQSTLTIMIHELRHALHLGQHSVLASSPLDRAAQLAKQSLSQMQQMIENSDRPERERMELKRLTTRLIGSFSEIVCHSGDRTLALKFRPDLAHVESDFIGEYRDEFNQVQVKLLKDPLTSTWPAIANLSNAVQWVLP